jgi:peptide/nickel transport system substrate-binding protein
MRNILLFMGLLIVFSLTLIGCSSSPSPSAVSSAPAAPTSSPPAAASSKPAAAVSPVTSPSAQPSALPQTGGTLNIFLRGTSVSSLGYPATMTGNVDGQIASPCVESLFRFDEQGNIVPLLAADWKAGVADKTITITLKKGIKFQDGSDFNAASCKWNLDQVRTSNRMELKAVTSIDVIDENTVRLNLAKFQNTLITYLAGDPGRMVSQTAFQNGGATDKDRIAYSEKHPVGTGAFQFVSYQNDVGVKYKRFDGYWDGKPYIDNLNFLIYGDKMVALMAFKAGNLDIFSPDPPDVKDLVNSGNFNVVAPPDGTISGVAGFATDAASPFANLKVRQAVSYAIDANAMANAFGLGYYKVTNQYAVPGTWAYNTNLAGYPFSPQKAKELLADAGYPNGFNTTYNFYNTSQDTIAIATTVQGYLKTVGINATLNPVLRPAFVDMASNAKGWVGLLQTISSTNLDPLIKYANISQGREFTGMYLPQEFVDAYNQALEAPDAAAKQKAVWNMASLANDKYCMASSWYVQLPPLSKSKKVHDDFYGNIPNGYLSPRVWISK